MTMNELNQSDRAQSHEPEAAARDRELLELAALAAGLNIKGECVDADDIFICLLTGFKNTRLKEQWNPLTDDGDALRLAVTLGLEIYHSINNDRWSVFVGYPKGQRIVYVFEEWGDDECVATRRAIVRAAAQIGSELRKAASGCSHTAEPDDQDLSTKGSSHG